MVKKVEETVKLQIPTGKATPTPPASPTLGQVGINIMGLAKEFNACIADQAGLIIPVVISIYEDRSFIFIIKTPSAAVLSKKAARIEKGSGEPNKIKVTAVLNDQMKEVAKLKMADLNAADVEAAMRMVAGTVRSMGIIIE